MSRADDSGAIRADQAYARFKSTVDEDGRIGDGDSLGDDHDRLDARVDRFEGGILRESRWHEDHGGVRAGCGHAFGDGAEYGDLHVPVSHAFGGGPVAFDLEGEGGACLAGVDSADDSCSRAEHAAGVFASFSTGHSLYEDQGVRVEEDRHCSSVLPSHFAAASSAAVRAASSIVSTMWMSG